MRDFVESSKAGDGLGMTLSALGLFPVLGEFFSFANKVKKIPLPEDKRKLYDFLVDNDLVDKYVHDEPLVRDFLTRMFMIEFQGIITISLILIRRLWI